MDFMKFKSKELEKTNDFINFLKTRIDNNIQTTKKKMKLDKCEFKIPEIHEYSHVIKYNYNTSQLKIILLHKLYLQ